MKTLEYIDSDTEYIIHIGENKRDNWEIIDDADDGDIWFHVENIPSCHVILKCSSLTKKPCSKVLKRCAYLCKIHTNSAKSLKKCNITYTYVACLEKTNHVGEVIARNCKTISV
jgi:predicted ribosome quality control (RQC) complex YloA/Tae2 family protein